MSSAFQLFADTSLQLATQLRGSPYLIPVKLFGSAAITLRTQSLSWWIRFGRPVTRDIDLLAYGADFKRIQLALPELKCVAPRGGFYFHLNANRIEAVHTPTGAPIEIWSTPLHVCLRIPLSESLEIGDGIFPVSDLLLCKLAYRQPSLAGILDLLILLEGMLENRHRDEIVDTVARAFASDYSTFALATRNFNAVQHFLLSNAMKVAAPYVELINSMFYRCRGLPKSFIWNWHRRLHSIVPSMEFGAYVSDPEADPWLGWQKAA